MIIKKIERMKSLLCVVKMSSLSSLSQSDFDFFALHVGWAIREKEGF